MTALEELMRKRGIDEAWTALEEMQEQGTSTDKYTVSRMLMKTVGDGRARMNPTRIYRGIAIVEKFIELQPKDVDEVLLNALLDTCCRLKDLTRLESIMQRMRDLKITASPVTLGILVKTYGQAGDIQKVLQVWSDMENQRGQANAVTYGCMIDACVKCNHLSKAVEIFTGMRECGKHRNTILYTTLIKGHGLEKDLASAMALFREMPLENVPYNTITYNSIIDACVKSGDLATAENLLAEITSPTNPLEPDLITFSTLLKGYCHGGELDKALQVAEAIKARGLRCDELVYNTLMDGCVKANDVTAGVGLFEEMVHNGMRPSAITHSILARLYQRAGYDEDANEAVAQLYAHHGIERPVGGDRSRGAGRRKGAGSPNASPMSGYGQNNEQWNAWGHDASGASTPCGSQGGWEQQGWGNWDHGYGSQFTSAASTPCGSPMQQPVGHGNSLMLPMDAMQSVPPLPGMGGSEVPPLPYGNSSPMASPYGSYQGSPHMSPAGAAPGANGQVQLMSAPANAGMPSLPQWPFPAGTMPGQQMSPCNMATFPQGTAPAMEASMPQFYQPSQSTMSGMAPAMGTVVHATTPHPDSGNYSFAPGAAGPNWQGQPADSQQSPFPMPLSPPHDLHAQSAATAGQVSQPQQAYFQFMPDNGQGGAGHQSPFCL